MALTDSLVSYWKLDEASGNAIDSHGSNHLTQVNNPVGATGKIGNGRDFETSSTQYLSHASNSDFQTGDIDFTFTLWVKFETLPNGITVTFIGKDVDTPATSRDYTLDCAAGSARFYGGGGGGGIASATMPNDLNWHFVAAWYVALENTVYIQVDNGSANVNTTTVPHVSSAEFRIGARAYSGFEAFMDGIIDEVGFWKRFLTPAERTELWNGGAGLAYPFGAAAVTTRPDHYYRMLRAA